MGCLLVPERAACETPTNEKPKPHRLCVCAWEKSLVFMAVCLRARRGGAEARRGARRARPREPRGAARAAAMLFYSFFKTLSECGAARSRRSPPPPPPPPPR